MNVFDVVFSEDIVLDEEAFNTAIRGFEELGQMLQKLREDVEEMVSTLKKGFDTPAGRKFVQACEANLYKPLDDQKLVLDHISETLEQSREKYQSVFDAYDELQRAINSVS